ncbi:hypothetical protein DYB38_003943 [Aphanomyces astaci]|uniref:DUF5745 domain-containing protein n=1 Tax=Aphanomyces astaci TaxID=112090 RepID=A0A397CKX6_APHAT|nr:hypothetical protein DYB38_003943 [Aphanomyces astaci]
MQHAATASGRERTRLLEDTNALLKLTGYGDRAFQSIDELVSSISSMCVALYERFFDLILDNVIREPRSLDDYSHNAQLVVDGLSAALLTEELQHVTGVKVCGGDFICIRDLVRVLTQVYQMLHRPKSRLGSSCSSSNDLSLDETFYIKRSSKKKKPATKKGTTSTSSVSGRSIDPSLQTTKKYGRFVPLVGSSHGNSFDGRDSRRQTQSKGAASRGGANEASPSQPRSSTSSKSKTKPSLRSAQPSTSPQFEPPVPRTLDFGSVSSVSFAGSHEELSGLEFSDSNDRQELSGGRLSLELSNAACELAVTSPQHASMRHDDGGSLHVDDLVQASMDLTPSAQSGPCSPPLVAAEAKPPPSKLPWDNYDEEEPRSPEATRAGNSTTTTMQPKAAAVKSVQEAAAKVRVVASRGLTDGDVGAAVRWSAGGGVQRSPPTTAKEMKLNQHIARSFQNKKHADHIDRIRTKKLHDELKLQRIALRVQQKRVEAQNLKDTMEHLLHLEKMRLKQEHDETTATLHAIQRQHADRELALEN